MQFFLKNIQFLRRNIKYFQFFFALATFAVLGVTDGRTDIKVDFLQN